MKQGKICYRLGQYQCANWMKLPIPKIIGADKIVMAEARQEIVVIILKKARPTGKPTYWQTMKNQKIFRY